MCLILGTVFDDFDWIVDCLDFRDHVRIGDCWLSVIDNENLGLQGFFVDFNRSVFDRVVVFDVVCVMTVLKAVVMLISVGSSLSAKRIRS